MPRPRLALLIVLALALALGGCSREPPVYRDRLLAFGTLIELSLYGVDEAAGRAASATLQRQFATQHAAWHAWQPGSELVELNRHLALGESMAVSAELRAMLHEAQRLSELSGGRFQPAIGRLIALWGFHADAPARAAPPSAEQIAALLAERPRMSDLSFDDDRVGSRNRAVQLDLGGFAKGVAVDRALARLRALGIEAAIVNAGGDLGVIGRPGARPWQIGIRDPRGEGVLASVTLEDGERLFTSGDYERFFASEASRYSHIIDPASGQPAAGAISVTVIHRDGGAADAAATALLVAGPEHWREVARALGLDHVLLIDSLGRAHLTPAMAARLQFETPPLERIVTAP